MPVPGAGAPGRPGEAAEPAGDDEPADARTPRVGAVARLDPVGGRALRPVRSGPRGPVATAAAPTAGSLALAPLPAVDLPVPGVQRANELAARRLPVVAGLETLFPSRGLRRGSVVGIASGVPGTTSLLLALLAGPSAAGSWCGIVGGGDTLSAQAIAEAGLDAARLPLVPDPGARWAEVAAALLDGLDVVAVHVPEGLGQGAARRLAARARKRGAVLVPYGAPADRLADADVVLRVVGGGWHGLGEGRGRLRGRDLVIAGRTRGRTERTTLRLPGYGRSGAAGDPNARLAGVTSLSDARARRLSVAGRGGG